MHFEDQLSSAKKCGHLGGKVLVPTFEAVNKLVAARLAAVVHHLLHPPLFRVEGGIDRAVAMLAHVLDALGNVIPLCLQHVRQIELKARLVATHEVIDSHLAAWKIVGDPIKKDNG